MANRNQNPWLRPIKAAGYSIAGFHATFKHEQAFRQELLILLLLVPLAIRLGDNGIEYSLLIGSWVMVLIVELLNSAVEAAVDRVSLEHNKLAGRAKDIGSSAVFLSIVLSISTWAMVMLVD